MLYELLLTLFVIVAFLLIMIIMIQQSKGSMGFGSFGGQAQMLFGGSGGQDLFQKTTWVLGAIFMFGSFGLTLMKHHQMQSSRYFGNRGMVQQRAASQNQPVTTPESMPQAPADEQE